MSPTTPIAALSELGADDAVESAFRLVQILQWRRTDLAAADLAGPAGQVMREVLDAIVTAEGKPVNEFDPAQVQKYITELSTFAQAAAKRRRGEFTSPSDAADRGKAVLSALRSQWRVQQSLRVFIGGPGGNSAQAGMVAGWVEEANPSHRVVRWAGDATPDVGLSKDVLLSLINVARTVDAAVLLWGGGGGDPPQHPAGAGPRRARDNVLIEYGLFAGILGPNKVVLCSAQRSAVPVDLAGVTLLDVSSERDRQAAVELRSWLDRMNPATVTSGGVAGERRAITEVVDAFKHRCLQVEPVLVDPQARAGRGDLLLNDPITEALAQQIYGYQQAHEDRWPVVLNQVTHLVIEGNGDCVYTQTQTIRATEQGQRGVAHFVSADDPVDPADVKVEVTSLTDGQRIGYLPLKEEPTRKSVFVYFEPPMTLGSERAYSVTWRWPNMWGRLVRKKDDLWYESVRSPEPVKHVQIHLSVAPSLPMLRLHSVGQVKGREVTPPESDGSNKTGYRQYLWEVANLDRNQSVVLRLEPC